MKLLKIRFFLLLNLLFFFNGCSYIKDQFPDKTKDYQRHYEIPAIVLPADLVDHDVKDAPVIQSQSVTPERIRQSQAAAFQDQIVGQTASANSVQPEAQPEIYIDIVEFSGGATRVRIEDNLERSWRRVGKALSRQSIEITNRNFIEKLYEVQYDANFKKVKDGSIWDEALFIFGDDPAQEKEYKIKLAQNGSLTEIIILDQFDQPLSDGEGLALLKLLYATMKRDLAS